MFRRYRDERLADPCRVADLIAISNLLRRNDRILAGKTWISMSHILAEARKFTAAFKSGDSGSAAAFRELVNLLLPQ
jgi:hypothetical protein